MGWWGEDSKRNPFGYEKEMLDKYGPKATPPKPPLPPSLKDLVKPKAAAPSQENEGQWPDEVGEPPTLPSLIIPPVRAPPGPGVVTRLQASGTSVSDVVKAVVALLPAFQKFVAIVPKVDWSAVAHAASFAWSTDCRGGQATLSLTYLGALDGLAVQDLHGKIGDTNWEIRDDNGSLTGDLMVVVER